MNNWRSNVITCPKGIFEIVSIHFLDLIAYYFPIEKVEANKLLNISGIGDSYDTAETVLTLLNGGRVKIFSTYYGPYNFQGSFLFENGILEFNPTKIVFRGPRSTFDKEGNFKYPKILKSVKFNSEKDYINSVENSVCDFMKIAFSKKMFPIKESDLAFYSNSLIC